MSSSTKKLKEFHDAKGALAKRYKSLISYTETTPPDELKAFFDKEAYNIWAVFLDTFQNYEQQKSPRKFEEIERLLSIMRNIFQYLPTKIKEKWQIRSIASILEKLLYKDNKYEVRQLGLELLMMFLEDLDTPDPPQSVIFSYVIDATPFIAQYPNAKIVIHTKVPTCPDKAQLLLPSASGQPTAEESIDIMSHFLNIITQQDRLFEFGWNLFKKYYIPLFYPDISKNIGILDKNAQDVGFSHHCPYEVQKLLITKLSIWTGNERMLKILWGSDSNIAILMEIYKQSVRLPIEYIEITRTSILMFHRLLLESGSSRVEKGALYSNFQKFYIEELPLLFISSDVSKSSTEQRASLCTEILDLFSRAFRNQDNMNLEIRDVLLFILIEITDTLLKRDNPNQELVKKLAPLAIHTLFYTWISSKCLDKEMWTRLQEGLAPIFHREETVSQIRLTLLQLSLILRSFIYPLPETKEKPKLEGSQNPNRKKDVQPVTPDDERAALVLPDENPLGNLPWNFEHANFVWNSILKIFNATNRMKDPSVHSQAIAAIADIMDLFLSAESKAPLEVILRMESQNQPSVPLTLLDTFGPLLFETCQLDDKFLKSKCLAFEALARTICRYQKANEVPHKILPHFYAVIHNILCNPPSTGDSLTYSVLDTTSNIFNLGLPGTTVLLPYYLMEIKRILKEGKGMSVSVVRKIVILLTSMISITSQFDDVEIQMKYTGHSQRQQLKALLDIQEEKINCKQLRDQISSVLVHLLRTNNNLEIKCMSIWSLFDLAMDQLFYEPSEDKIKEIIEEILGMTTYAVGGEIPDQLVGISALDALTSFAQVNDSLKSLNPQFRNLITEGIAKNVQRELESPNLEREHLLCAHYESLIEWLMLVPELLDDGMMKTISTLISAGIHINRKVSTSNASKPDEPTVYKASLKYTAMFMFNLLMYGHRHFPAIPGIEFSPTALNETDETNLTLDEIPHFIFNGEVVLSAVEISDPDQPNQKKARLFARTPAGKFAWDFSVNRLREKEVSAGEPIPITVEDTFIAPGSASPMRPRIRKSELPEPPVSESLPVAGVEDDNVDKIDELLLHLGKKYSNLVPAGLNNLLQPVFLPEQYLPDIAAMQSAYISQAAEDSKYLQQAPKSVPLLPMTPRYQRPEKVPAEVNIMKSYSVQRILTQLGYVGDTMDSIKLVEQNKAFQLKIRNLDKMPCRDVIKVGLLYVGPNQEAQGEILANNDASDMYKEFVAGMAWEVEMATHKGYKAGLDENGSTGKISTYYAGPLMELMFHEVVKMPTTEDKTHLLKKRHVGNDMVHVVWSENIRDYNPRTIVSQFNNAHIIIYPLNNGLFRVTIAKKPEVPIFGPLLHGMTVSKQLLPLLVRQTAINAHRYCYADKHDSQFAVRSRALSDIITKAATKATWEDTLYGVLVKPPVDPAAASNPAPSSTSAASTPTRNPALAKSASGGGKTAEE